MKGSGESRVLLDAMRVVGSGMRARTASLSHAAVWAAAVAGVALVMAVTWPTGPVEPRRPPAEVTCWVLYAALVISALLASGYSSGRLSYLRELSVEEWIGRTTVSPAGLVAGKLADAWIASCLFIVSAAPLLLASLGPGTLRAGDLARGLGFTVAVLGPFCVAGFAVRVLLEGRDASSLALDAYLVTVLIATAFLPGLWAELNPVVALAHVIHRSPEVGPAVASASIPGWLVCLAAHGMASVGLGVLSVRALWWRRKEGG